MSRTEAQRVKFASCTYRARTPITAVDDITLTWAESSQYKYLWDLYGLHKCIEFAEY